MRLLLLFALIVGSGSAWGQVTIWSEDFSGYSAENVPSGSISLPHTGTSLDASGTLTYTCTNGTKTSGSTNGGTTAVKNEAVAEGTKPEIMVGKKGSGTGAVGGSFTATVPLDNIAGTITLKYKQNAYSLKVTMTAGSATTNATKDTKAEQTVTLSGITADMTSVTIKFEATSTSNVRLDNIVLTGNKAEVPITSIAFSEPKTASVSVGGTTTLTPTILPANYNKTVDWESDATGVATVNSAGVVTGVATGTAHITARAHDNPSTIYDVCTVTVTAAIPVTGVSLKSSTTLLLGGTETLTPSFTPVDATNKNVTWESSDDEKVSVDENGVITGLALTGGSPVTITVTTEDGGYTATCDVIVNPVPVSGIELDKTTASIRINKTVQLTATVSPDNATDKSVTWESDDTGIATVSESGLVTGVAVGTATITVKSNADNTQKATCTITVTDGAIDLSPGDVIVFDDFSGAGGSYGSGVKLTDFTADDDNDYEWSGTNYMSSTGLQLKANAGTITSPVVKAPYGYKLEIVRNNYVVDVYIGEVKQTTVSSNTWELSNNTAFTFKNNTGNAAKVTKVTITALKQPAAINVDITNPGTLATGATGTFTYTKDSEVENTKVWSSNDDDVIEIKNAATGAYEAKGRGTATITLTITPTDATNYKSVSAERSVNVTAPVEITASDVEMTFGDAAKAIGATTSAYYAGTLTYESGNTSIATVDASGNVTAFSAGTTTITISAPADAEHLYTAGEDVVINVTVNAMAGAEETPEVTEGNIYYTNLKSTPTGWNKDTNWSYHSTYGAVTTSGETSGTYDLTSKEIDLSGYNDITLKFQHTGNGQSANSSSFSAPADACKVYIQEGSNDPVQLTINYFSGKDWNFVSSGDIDLNDYKNKTVHFIFRYTPTDGNNGKWEVTDLKITGTPTASVTVASSGFSTHCYQYPLDLDQLDEDVKAYIVTNVSGTDITFKRIKGTIKGGVPFILYGTAGEHTLYTAASSTNVPEGNMLVGTLTPKYIETTDGSYTNFGLKNGKFVKAANGVIGANKAYLPILTSYLAGSREFGFIFDDEDVTGIESISNTSEATKANREYYNLNGQRVANPSKGVYIVNGKKVIIK